MVAELRKLHFFDSISLTVFSTLCPHEDASKAWQKTGKQFQNTFSKAWWPAHQEKGEEENRNLGQIPSAKSRSDPVGIVLHNIKS